MSGSSLDKISRALLLLLLLPAQNTYSDPSSSAPTPVPSVPQQMYSHHPPCNEVQGPHHYTHSITNAIPCQVLSAPNTSMLSHAPAVINVTSTQ